jgi:hypothetical protein
VPERWRIAGYGLVFVLLLAQGTFSRMHPRDWQADRSPQALPSVRALTLMGAGETEMVATLLALRLQTFDAQAGRTVALRTLDGERIFEWLSRAAELSPLFRYPTFMASRIYAETLPEQHARRLLDWIDERFALHPEAHWAWQAYAVHLAEHRLDDKPLARELAAHLRERAEGTQIPPWARDLEFFLLTDLDEVEAARALLGGLIDSGQLDDERALRAMLDTLEEAERRRAPDARPPVSAR